MCIKISDGISKMTGFSPIQTFEKSSKVLLALTVPATIGPGHICGETDRTIAAAGHEWCVFSGGIAMSGNASHPQCTGFCGRLYQLQQAGLGWQPNSVAPQRSRFAEI